MSGLDLYGEEKCKKMWKPWFDAGGWRVQDFTKPETAKFQISDILNKIKNSEDKEMLRPLLYNFLNCFDFPHDGEATRGRFTFCFDYKYKPDTRYGIWIKVKDYNKYWSYHKPWFYILVWAEDRQKRYMHQLCNPAKYPKCLLDYYYYKIPDDDWWEPNPMLQMPIMVPENLSDVNSLAFIFAVNREPHNPTINADDKAKARKIVTSQKREILKIMRRIRLRRRASELKSGSD